MPRKEAKEPVKVGEKGFWSGLKSKLNPLRLLSPERKRPWKTYFDVESLSATIPQSAKMLDKYEVDNSAVFIYEDKGRGYYHVEEPSLSSTGRKIYASLMRNITYSMSTEAAGEDPMEYIEGAILDAADDLGLIDEVSREFQRFRYYISKGVLGYGRIHIPMRDPEIEEIGLNSYLAPVRVIHRRFTGYNWLETNIKFNSEEEVVSLNRRLAQRTGRGLTVAVPYVETMTEEGGRLALTLGDEITHPGSILTIRKPMKEPLSLPRLASYGTLSPGMAAYIWEVLELKGSVNVIGEAAAGKTTTMNAGLGTIPSNYRVITIEDTLEVMIPHRNWISLHTRSGSSIGGEKFDVDLMSEVKHALRHRPDYLVIGETRGREIDAVPRAAGIGCGFATTFHARDADEAVTSMQNPPCNLSRASLSKMWSFVTMQNIRMPSGERERRATSIDEIVGREGEEEVSIEMKPIFGWKPEKDEFTPKRLSTVVKRSSRLRKAAESIGLTRKKLKGSLREKEKIVKRMIKEDRLGFREFSKEVEKYYASR